MAKDARAFEGSRTRDLVFIALAGATAYVLAKFTKFPIFASAPFLKLDFGETPLLIITIKHAKLGLFALLVKEILSFVVSGSNIFGLFADFATCGIFITVFGITSSDNISLRRFAAAAVFGALARMAAAIPVNLFVLRLQFGAEATAIWAQMPLIMLFNLIKCGLGGCCVAYFYPRLRKYFMRFDCTAQHN